MKNEVSTSNNSTSGNFTDKENYEKMVNKVQDIGQTIKERSESAVEASVEFAKKYPVYTALGTGIVGLAIGLLTGKMRR